MARLNPRTGQWSPDPSPDEVRPEDLITAPAPVPVSIPQVGSALLAGAVRGPQAAVDVVADSAEQNLAPVPGEPPPGEPPPRAEAPAIPPVVVPPGPGGVGVSQIQTERTVLSPESKAALRRGEEASQQQGAAAERSAAAGKARAVSELTDQAEAAKAEARQAAVDAKQAEIADTRQQLAEARHQEASAKADQRIADAQKRVDADFETSQKGYWADKSTGFKIIAALLAGSSVRNAYILGQDPDKSPIVAGIRELAANDKAKKLAQYTKSKEYLAEARKGPELARQALLDARTDIDAGYNRQLQITLKKAEALKASRKVDPQRLQALIGAASAQADLDLADTRQKIVDRDLQRAAQRDSRVTTTQTSGAGKNADTLIYGEGGRPIAQAKTPEQAKEANKATKTFRQLDGLLSALEESYRTNGKAYNPFSDTYQDQKTLKAQADIAYKNVAELGALSGSDNTLINNAIGGAWTGKQGVEKLRAARDAMARGHAAALDSVGLPGKQLVQRLRTPQSPAAPKNDYADVSVADLRAGLVAASKAGDKEAIKEARAALKARGAK